MPISATSMPKRAEPSSTPSSTASMISSLPRRLPAAMNGGAKRSSASFTPSRQASSTFSKATRRMAS